MPDARPYQRVLALINFDGTDERIMRKALLLARLNRAQLDLLHMIAPDGTLDGGYPGSARQATMRDLERGALRRLDYLAGALAAGEAHCHAIYGLPSQVFRQYALEQRPDLVVTGEQMAFLDGACDVLVLSGVRRAHGGRLRLALMNLPGLRRWPRLLAG